MRIAQFRVSDRGQMALPADARHRWELDEGGTVEIADLGDALLIVPAGRGGLRNLLRGSIDDAGGYAKLAAEVAADEIWLERAHSGGRRPPPPTNSVERRAGIAPTYWCTGAYDRALVPPAEPSALQPDSRGHPFPAARQSRPVDRGRRSPSSYGAT